MADSGEDAIAFSDGSDYAANVETAAAAEPGPRSAPGQELRKIETPTQKTCEAVAALLGITLQETVKSVATMAGDSFVLALVRGDHDVNAIKLGKLPGMADYRMATEAEILEYLGSEPGSIGPVNPRGRVRIVADREVAAMADFVVGANQTGHHLAGVNWARDLPEPDDVADIRDVIEGDRAADGGTLHIARGIEVGHVFQLGRKYSQAMDFTVLDEKGGNVHPAMGCYGIGVSRIVAAAIEQNHDQAGILWPQPMAPWRVAVCIINPKKNPEVDAAAEALYAELAAAGIEAVLDDRGLRPGPMFADIELIGIPHRVVVSERGLAAGTFEYRARTAEASENLDRSALMARLVD